LTVISIQGLHDKDVSPSDIDERAAFVLSVLKGSLFVRTQFNAQLVAHAFAKRTRGIECKQQQFRISHGLATLHS
jgi:hypothetical protein